MLTRFSKKLQIVLNNFLEPATIRSSESDPVFVNNGDIPKHDWKRTGPHIIKFAAKGERAFKEYTVKDLSRLTGVEYLSQIEFHDEKTSARIKEQCAHSSKNGYIDSKRKWLGALYANQIRSHYVADVSIHWINETLEYGLFAEEDIGAWEFVGEYTGVIRRHLPIIGKISDYCFLYPTSRYFYGKHFLDAEEKGNEIRYANHSDDPNCEVTGIFVDDMFHMMLRAIKYIPANSQITYDYGPRYWRSRPCIPNDEVGPPSSI